MGDISIKGRSPLLKVGGISRLTGNTGGVKEVFPGMGLTGGASRGKAKSKSDFSLKNQVKKIQKMPDKKFKHVNLETKTYKSDRTGKNVTVQKTDPVKGSKGKKNYINETKRYHHRNKEMMGVK